MHAQAQHVWHTANPHPELSKQYWSLPSADSYAALMHIDSRCRYEPGEGDEIIVPAPLPRELLSAVWGPQAKLAAKGVWKMRICSVQHAALSTRKRVGRQLQHQLRRVQAADFGVELSYIAIAETGLTPGV